MPESTTLLLVEAGSHAYGLATPESDHDTRGVYVMPTAAYLFGLVRAKPIKSADEDRVLWDLRQFVALAAGANTQALEVLYAPETSVLGASPEGKLLRQERALFLSKGIFRVVSGYALSEYRRAIGEGTRKLGALRKTHIERYGYSPKNASHCLRLLSAGIIALTTGQFPVHVDDQDDRRFLLDLKRGNVERDDFEVQFQRLDRELKAAHATSTLPEKVDRAAINELAVRCFQMLEISLCL